MAELLAGTDVQTITPPLGAPLVGATQPSTGVHDDLYAKALVLSDGRQRVAIVSLDLVGMNLAECDAIRAEVRNHAGIAATFLCCTHTHSAPFTVPWSRVGNEWFTSAEGRQWRRDLVPMVTRTVCRAAGNLADADLRTGRVAARIGSNRRLPAENGLVMKPNPSGPVAPWVDVLRVDRMGGPPRTVLFSHAAHPVIVHGASTLVSADYPGYATREIERRIGGGVTAMFAQGCGANINGDPLRGGFDAADRAGQILGAAATEAAVAGERIEPAELWVTSATLALPFQELPSPHDCHQALAEAEARLVEATDGDRKWWLLDNVLCLRDLLERSERGTRATLRFEIQVLAIGKTWCLLAMPHEVFVEYQLWTDAISPFAHTMVLAYTNGCESYVPTDNDLALGGYEAAHTPAPSAALRYPYRAALKPGIESQIKEQIRALLTNDAP